MRLSLKIASVQDSPNNQLITVNQALIVFKSRKISAIAKHVDVKVAV